MNSENCPQCCKEINTTTNRLVQDACGHKKCRLCLMQDEVTCKMCIQVNKLRKENQSPTNLSVIKYDDSHRKTQCETVKTENTNDFKTSISSVINCDSLGNKNLEVGDASEESEVIKNKDAKSKHKTLNLPSHIIYVSKSPVKYKCTVCMKMFSTHTSVRYHKYCAGTEKPLKCNECNKRFISRSHLEVHIRGHTGNRPFVCTLCKKSFLQKSKLNRHMKLHTGDKPFVCSECGKRFSNKDALKTHNRIHSNERPFACKKCDLKFITKSNLTAHEITHTKEKKYMCEECGKIFSVRWSLIFHKRTHSREKPFVCEMCPKSFNNSKDLNRHSLKHLGVKPYKCNLCSTKFRRKDSLIRHSKNTHSTSNNVLTESSTESSKTLKNTNCKSPKSKSASTIENNNKFEEKPNAINVIKSNQSSEMKNAVPVINGPFKLAFKTDVFRNNYNIYNRYCAEPPPRIQTKKPYDKRESLNICQRILSPMSTSSMKTDNTDTNKSEKPKNVIMSVSKVNEQESLEICKKILSPPDAPPIHYETSFEHKKHAFIKNIKFKLPSTYTNNAIKVSESDEQIEDDECKKYEELTPVKLVLNENLIKHCQQSVIVNPQSIVMSQQLNASSRCNNIQSNEMHWRRRTSQSLQPK